MDDVRVGRFIRLARKRRGWRQIDLATRSRLSQSAVSLIERGHLSRLSVAAVREVCGQLDASASIEVRWRAGALDRLLDEGHAALVEVFGRRLDDSGWELQVEVTYSVYGERGSIDILGWHAATASLLVVEVKTEITAIEATMRKLDEKARLARQIALERFGWTSSSVSVVLVLPEASTARRRVAAHSRSIGSKLPARTAEVHRWLRSPSGRISGIAFSSVTNGRGTGRRQRRTRA